MTNHQKPNPLPEEDLGRGGEAGTSFPAGTPGEREEISRENVRQPSARGPRRPEPSPPPSSGG
jgi:hypothetical protein